MTAEDASDIADDDLLSDATVRVARSHWLLSGIVEASIHPTIRSDANEALDMLADAIDDLRRLVALRAPSE